MGIKDLLTLSSVLILPSFHVVCTGACGANELIRPDLLHVQRTDLVLFTAAVSALNKPGRGNNNKNN